MLKQYWYNPQTLDTPDRQYWGYVVLQEQSTRPADEPEQMQGKKENLSNN